MRTAKPEISILLLCTGNSCHSQIAEAIFNAQYSDWFSAFSDGIKPTGYVHPLAIQVHNQLDIKQNGRSKHVNEFFKNKFDIVVSVYDSASEECSAWFRQGKQLQISYYDPAQQVNGTPDEVLNVFRQVRDDITVRVSEALIPLWIRT